MPHGTTRISVVLPASLRHNAVVLARALPRARRGEIRAIHRVRVATRRLREALLVDGDREQQRLTKDLRRIAKAFGPVRELDVARDVLARRAMREAWPAAVVARIDSHCERLRQQAFETGTDALADLDTRELRRRLIAVADQMEASRSSSARAIALGRLRERARLFVREIEAVGTLYAPAPLHKLRIAAKKLRYMIELAGENEPGSLRRIKRLQGDLGRLHDTQVLQQKIQELASGTNDRGFVSTLTGMHQALESRCREWHAQALKGLPAISRLARVVERSVPASIGPRQLGKPAGMRTAAPGRDRKERIA